MYEVFKNILENVHTNGKAFANFLYLEKAFVTISTKCFYENGSYWFWRYNPQTLQFLYFLK